MTHNKDATRYFSGKQEKYIAEKFGGYLSSNSGASDFSAGDVVLENYLVECKTCMKDQKSFTIQKEWLEKIKKEAFFKNKDSGIVAFNFGPESKENYFIIDENLMHYLIEKTKLDNM